MKILIAEDDPYSRDLLQVRLMRWAYEVVATCDGDEAWAELQREDAPRLAILDWMMPGMDGLEVCRRARRHALGRSLYLILLTARGERDDIVTGLDAGADDYLTKPFNPNELRARVAVGARTIALQDALADRICALEDALSHIELLQGILPICSYCKKIRGDQDYWQQVEAYFTAHAPVQFSHCICPACYEAVVKPEMEQMRRGRKTELAILDPVGG